MKTEIKESIRILIEDAFNAGNTSVLDDIIHPDYVYRSPNETMQGPEELKGFIAGFRAAFPDLNLEINEQIIDDGKASTSFTMTGTHQGSFFGISTTGKPVKIHGMVISRLEEGKIIEEWEILDQFALFQQLGEVFLPE